MEMKQTYLSMHFILLEQISHLYIVVTELLDEGGVTKFKQFDEEITLISCTQIEKVDNVDIYFFSQVRGQLVQMFNLFT